MPPFASAAPGKSESLRVTVLGAGIAGLVAAYELAANGHTVEEVLEAGDRAGGRIYTHTFGNGAYGKLGEMRIAAAHNYTHHYMNQLELPAKPFPNSTDCDFWHDNA